MSDCQNRPIYLDYHSTTPVDRRVAEKVLYYMTTAFGNPSSMTHCYSDEAEQAVNLAREQVAELINANSKEIIFTSGATESINLAIFGCIKSCDTKHKIAVLPLEHKAVLDTCKNLSKKNIAETIYLKIDSKGRLDLEDLEEKCKQGLSLICVMAVNNEIGNIYPFYEIGSIAEKYNIPFLCDATQAVGKIDIDFEKSKITYMALSAHKMYGPKGIGALVVKKGKTLNPLLCGGGQQRGIRPGTLNVSGIVGLGECCRIAKEEMNEDNKRIRNKRDMMQRMFQDKFPEMIINGDSENRIDGNLSLSILGTCNSEIISRIRHKVAISTGSACSSGASYSHVLSALNIPEEVMSSTLRIGLGKYTSDEDIKTAFNVISEAINEIKNKVVV
ncbi:MAG: cysteine desulfurase family protein [Candidatus Sericytochromatia bacterium]